jgi:hypothetical protein
MAISSQEMRVQEMEHAKISSVALGVLQGPIEEAKSRAMNKLISMYRSKQISHDALVGIAAELSALDELVANLTSDVRRGEVAFEQEHSNGKARPNNR